MSSKKGKSTKKFQLSSRRVFSEALKRKIVSDIDAGLIKIKDISTDYNVSKTSIYKWIGLYSLHNKNGRTQVVQMKSEERKTKQLYARVQELEATIGRKQLAIDYLEQLIALASKELGYDIKKR